MNFRLRKDKFSSTLNVSGVLISLTFSGRDVSGDDVSVWVRVPDLVGMREWEGRTRRKVVGFVYRVYMSVYDEVSFVLSPPTVFSDDEEKEIWGKIVSVLTDPYLRGRLGSHGDKVLGFVYDSSLVDIPPVRLGGEV